MFALQFADFQRLLRRERDSNPRYSCPYTAFRVRPDRPLRHLSSVAQTEYSPKEHANIGIFFLCCSVGCDFFVRGRLFFRATGIGTGRNGRYRIVGTGYRGHAGYLCRLTSPCDSFSSRSFCNSYMRSRNRAAARKSSDLAARSISSLALAIKASISLPAT